MIKFSMIPSGHFPLFLSSVLMITTSPPAGVSPPAPYCARSLLRRLRKYSLVHRLHTASLHFSKCFACFRRSAVSMWCGCNSGCKLLFKNNIAFSVRRGICTISTSSRTSCNSFHHSRPFPIVLFRADFTRPINLSNYPPHHRVRWGGDQIELPFDLIDGEVCLQSFVFHDSSNPVCCANEGSAVV